MTPLEVMVFDIGGTLVRLGRALGFTARVRRELGLAAVDDRLREAVRRHFFLARGSRAAALRALAVEWGLDDVDRFVVRLDEPTPRAPELHDDVVPTLRVLRDSGLRLVGLSNTTPWEAASREDLGLEDLMDDWLLSFELRVCKPDAHAYAIVERRLGVSGGAVCMVGDCPDDDIAGAAVAGWRTVQVRRPDSPFRVSEVADAVVPTLHDLPDALGAWRDRF